VERLTRTRRELNRSLLALIAPDGERRVGFDPPL
jgi:hypothetical protein